MTEGMVSNIQRFSIHDGPGIRTAVFFKGCPLRCAWCANPETQRTQAELLYNARDCRHCYACVAACPERAVSPREDGSVRIDRQKCTLCGACVRACNYGALYFEGRPYTVEELLEEVRKDRSFYEKSGGGVTISGGEPFFQPAFLLEFLKALGGEGIHTAVETSGFAPEEIFLSALPDIRLLFYDLKHPDSAQHRRMTGAGNERILSNLSAALEHGADVIVRIPVIPGYNDTPEATAAYREIFRSLGVKAVHLLPFHGYGAGKYDLMDIPYAYRDTPSTAKEQLEGMRAALAADNRFVQIGG